jgi:hypothetical protein
LNLAINSLAAKVHLPSKQSKITESPDIEMTKKIRATKSASGAA